MKQDFPGDTLEQRREERRAKASGQRVETFVANEWTLEFDLAYFGLEKLVWGSAALALGDDGIQAGSLKQADVINAAETEFKLLVDQKLDKATLASHVYAKFEIEKASKAIAAQYLAESLEALMSEKKMTCDQLRDRLPPYVIAAIEYVTAPFDANLAPGKSGDAGGALG